MKGKILVWMFGQKSVEVAINAHAKAPKFNCVSLSSFTLNVAVP